MSTRLKSIITGGSTTGMKYKSVFGYAYPGYDISGKILATENGGKWMMELSETMYAVHVLTPQKDLMPFGRLEHSDGRLQITSGLHQYLLPKEAVSTRQGAGTNWRVAEIPLEFQFNSGPGAITILVCPGLEVNGSRMAVFSVNENKFAIGQGDFDMCNIRVLFDDEESRVATAPGYSRTVVMIRDPVKAAFEDLEIDKPYRPASHAYSPADPEEYFDNMQEHVAKLFAAQEERYKAALDVLKKEMEEQLQKVKEFEPEDVSPSKRKSKRTSLKNGQWETVEVDSKHAIRERNLAEGNAYLKKIQEENDKKMGVTKDESGKYIMPWIGPKKPREGAESEEE